MYKINSLEFEELADTLKAYSGNAEEAINEVLHNYAGNRAQEEIRRLMPVSNRHWKGKAPAAKASKSMRNIPSNLAVKVTTQRKWGYLYFADDGTNTKNHIGNQRFFERGGEAAMPDIVARCKQKLTENF